MSPNKAKRKGSDWERTAVKLLNEHVKSSEWKRVPGSGALGSTLTEPILMSDIKGSMQAFPKQFRIECKTGYGGSTQLTVKKEWLDKVRQEAEASYSFPLLLGKFLGASSGVKAFAIMDIDALVEILNYITELKERLDNENTRI